jgi:hypothetical protein
MKLLLLTLASPVLCFYEPYDIFQPGKCPQQAVNDCVKDGHAGCLNWEGGDKCVSKYPPWQYNESCYKLLGFNKKIYAYIETG